MQDTEERTLCAKSCERGQIKHYNLAEITPPDVTDFTKRKNFRFNILTRSQWKGFLEWRLWLHKQKVTMRC